MKIDLQVEGATREQIEKYKQIFSVLIEKGALDGVRGGQAIIHFDAEGNFQGIQFDYWPWRKIKDKESELQQLKLKAKKFGLKFAEN